LAELLILSISALRLTVVLQMFSFRYLPSYCCTVLCWHDLCTKSQI